MVSTNTYTNVYLIQMLTAMILTLNRSKKIFLNEI